MADPGWFKTGLSRLVSAQGADTATRISWAPHPGVAVTPKPAPPPPLFGNGHLWKSLTRLQEDFGVGPILTARHGCWGAGTHPI